MPAVKRRRRLLATWVWTILFAATFGASSQADTLTVNVDEAKVIKLPDRVATIVIGNPLIADAALQAGGMLVITGKGYGATNMVVLDRAGKVLMDKSVQVAGPADTGLVVVYKGIERESYSCVPDCAPRITLGDSMPYFTTVLTQAGARSSGAQTPNGAK
jgi:hypothetical protein